MSIPKDPNILFSYVNMMLRDDEYESLEDFCVANDVSPEDIKSTLASVGYVYEEAVKQFRPV
jgi:hypothetical protein